jgi:transposase InsO family protein|tara:strand:- start:96 stop:971 length:876 start_codon:yes stop_codon:yes gene_type:complete
MSAKEVVAAGQGILSIVDTCELLGISRSSYYDQRSKKPSVRALKDAALVAEIRAVFAKTKKRYGSPRIMRALRKRGVRVGKKRVARLMRQNGLVARPKKRFRVTTNSEHNHPIAPNLLKRDFTADAPNKVWVGDITYVWTHEGWMYLATIIDVFSRRVVGWAMRSYLSRQLAMEALSRAIELRRPKPGLIHHTDRGCQYASKDYRKLLKSVGIQQSMSRSGNCLDNAMAESFFSTLEHELLMQNNFQSRSGALWAVAEYIENFYNRERLHSGLDYESPVEYEESQLTANAA